MKIVLSAFFSALLLFSSIAVAGSEDKALEDIKKAWIAAKYEKTGKEQSHAFELLLEQINQFRDTQTLSDAVLDCWEGTTLSSYASTVGGTRALSMVKKARSALESALEKDERVEDGLALGVLGTLYHRVPTWPIAYKDDKKARRYLQKALSTSPDGAHSQFYYGEYLAAKGQTEEAKSLLTAALAAAESSSDPLSHARGQEIKEALSKLGA